MHSIPEQDLIFLDESGVDLALVRLYGRALRGQRCYGAKPQKRGKRVSLLGALSLDKVLVCHPVLGNVDGITLEAFVVTKLLPHLQPGMKVVMDNASIHQGEQVRKAIESQGAELIFLSRYSPEFSPIEQMWSKVKNFLRKKAARTYQDLIDGVLDAIFQVTIEDIRNWYTHCCYCTS